MLHRSFKGGKCKTSLKLAMARIKLLRNKRETQVRQMKRDLAQLLEAGQEQTARVRVEHVVREEKTMAAYDLLDIYCELIVARLPIIESQKNCPIDLKEAITSVIFASPRCADVPELLDVRKHFTAKYGKEFVTSALELRPECGVNRTMVEKLSARAPDGETKIKILVGIAQEHNVKWDPNDFGEKPSDDLLNGPSTFEPASKIPVQPPAVHPATTPGPKYESPTDIMEKRSSLNAQANAPPPSTASMPQATSSYPESRPSGHGNEEIEPSPNDRSAYSFNRPKWNMEFKDATSAAQAAAEAAERASMAARAAAELSSFGRIRSPYSTGLHESSAYGLRDEGHGPSTGTSFKGEHDSVRMAHDSRTSFPHGVDPGVQIQQKDRSETHNLRGSTGSKYDTYDSSRRISSQSSAPAAGSTGSMNDTYDSSRRRSSQSDASGFNMTSTTDGRIVDKPQEEDRFSQTSPSEVGSYRANRQARDPERGDLHREVSSKSRQSEVEPVNQHQHNNENGYTGFAAEGGIRKQSSKSSSSSSSHYRISIDDDTILDPDIQNDGNYEFESSFKNTGQGNVQKGSESPSPSAFPDVHFDDYASEEESNLGILGEYNSHDAPSPVRESPSHYSPVMNTRTSLQHRGELERDNSSSKSGVYMESHSHSTFFERVEKPVMLPESDDLLPANYDSDGRSSESEEEMDIYKRSGRTQFSSPPRKQNIFTNTADSVHIDEGHGSPKSSFTRKETPEAWLYSSHDDLESEDRDLGTKSYGVEAATTYSRHRSNKSSSTEKEAIIPETKPRSPSPDDDWRSRSAYSLKNNDSPLDVEGGSQENYDYGVKPFASRTRSPRTPDQEPQFDQGMEEKQQSTETSRPFSAIEAQGKEDYSALKSLDSVKDPESPSLSRLESGQGLNFGRLTGGIRNKGYSRRTIIREPSTDGPPKLRPQSTKSTLTVNEEPIVSPKYESQSSPLAQDRKLYNESSQKEVRKEVSSRTYQDFDNDDTETFGSKGYTRGGLSLRKEGSRMESTNREPSTDASPSSRKYSAKSSPTLNEQPTVSSIFKSSSSPIARENELYDDKSQMEVRQHDSPRSSRTYSDLDYDDSDVLPRKTVGHMGYTSGGLSRRKKDSPAMSNGSSFLSSVGESDVPVTSRLSTRRKDASSMEQRTRTSVPLSEASVHKESPRHRWPKDNSSLADQPSKSMPKPDTAASASTKAPLETVASGSSTTAKPSISNEGDSSKGNSFKKASHVHPKLPDYDSFAAHFEALKSNRS